VPPRALHSAPGAANPAAVRGVGDTDLMLTTLLRRAIAEAIAADELWIARARQHIEPDVDCSSIEDSIDRKRRDVERMRALLK
jgi:hypothetical protein